MSCRFGLVCAVVYSSPRRWVLCGMSLHRAVLSDYASRCVVLYCVVVHCGVLLDGDMRCPVMTCVLCIVM